MEMGLGSILLLISLFSLIPYSIVILLKFFLWKFSFTARVNGFFSFSEIMLRVPLHLNFSVLFRVERVSVSFTLTSRMLKISTYGLQIYLLVKNDFNLWTSRKIEILQMLEDIRTTLKRKGQLKSTLMLASGLVKKASTEYFGHAAKEPNIQAPLAENGAGGGVGLMHQKKFLERMLDKVLSSIEVSMQDTIINFYAYKDDDKKIEEANIKRFYTSYLQDQGFRDLYLCFRVFVPSTEVNVKQLTDEEMDLQIRADTVLLQNPKSLNKQGVLRNATIIVKVPLDAKLAKDLCNFDMRINILRGSLNFNKLFIRALTKFLVTLDTTKVIINRIRRLIIKLHYQDELLKMMQKQPGSTGVETLYKATDEYNYENILDIDIPKRLKVVIEEGLTICMSEYSKSLRPFLSGGVVNGKPDDTGRKSELIVLNSNQFTFELLRTLKNSYYLSCQSDKITIDCNMKRSITISNFINETDFSYKRPITDFPITTTKMEITNSIKAESVSVDLTFCEIKLVLDIIGIYQEMVHIASVKNVIMSTLLDREFLKSNLLHLGTSQEDQIKESQIMLLFQEAKHKDTLINDVLLSKIEGKILTYDPKNSLAISAQNYQMRLRAEKGVDELIHRISFLNVQPVSPKSISLLKIQSFENLMVVTRGNDTNIQDISTQFDKCHMCLNMDYILGLTREILDLSIIVKTYTRKWNFKYKVKEFIKQTVVESLNFSFQETQFVWYLSHCRFIVFKASNFKTKSLQCPFKKEDKVSICYFAKEFSMFHVLTINEQTVPGIFYCEPSEEKKIQGLIEMKDFEFFMLINEKELKMRYTSKALEFNLPEDIHFCGLIFEMVKQIMVSRKWFSQEYIKLKRKYNLQFIKPPSSAEKQSYQHSQNLPATQPKKRTLFIQVDVQDVLAQVDDKPIKQLFVNKNEVVDTLLERDLFKCKGQNIFKLLKKLKNSKLNEKIMIVQSKNFRMTYNMPQQFLDFNQVYQMILKLDEAKDFMNPGLFSSFDGAIHSYKCDYVSMHTRNLLQPLAEAWDLDLKFLIVIGLLNADTNPQLFRTKISDKIFNNYEVSYSYNKLLPKMFYDGDLKIQKIKLTIQGQQTFLFFNDMASIFSKFAYEDISKSKDPRGQKLSYYSGLDFLRHKMHGKVKVQITLVEALIYPKRKFNRYDSYLNCTFSELYFNQVHYNQEVALRNLTVSKQPLRHFESALLKIPLIEVNLSIIYNQGKTLNHYTQNGVQNIGQLLESLKAYSSHEVELDSKINIPSLGTRNDSDRPQNPIAQIIPMYVLQSPIPIMHYQRSHMKFIDQMIHEYLKKADYSNSTPLKRDRANQQSIKNKRAYLFKIRTKAFISDVMILFSDFKEKLTDGYYHENVSRMDSKQLKLQRDKYLAVYQGIMFSMENMCFKAQISVSKQKDGTHVEMKNSGIQSHFMKLAFMNSSNIFQIRHQCFKQLRDRQYDQSLDNPKHFWAFFELNTSQSSSQAQSYQELSSNSILSTFKTINPTYVLGNPQLQQEIMIATLNPNSMNPLFQGQYSGDTKNDYCRHQNILDDFVFANTDTIQTIILINYCQDQEISFYHNSTSKLEERQKQKQRAQNPLILDVQPASQIDEERFTVKHMIDVKGIRFLYTKQTLELIIHHLINSFDYEKFRKTDFIDVENSQDKYHYGGHGGKKSHHDHSSSNSKGDSQINQTPINVKNLRKVALIGIRIEDPQINFQNQFTKSQMLLSTAFPTTAIIFGYHKFQLGSRPSSETLHGNEEMHHTKSGYQIKFHEELVKVDLQIQVVEMDIYVAPTVINLENPTFWISNVGESGNPNSNVIATSPSEQVPSTGGGFSARTDGSNKGAQEKDNFHSENLLRKIFSVTNISFTFDFFFAEFVDVLNPVMAIDILVEKLESEMSGPNMWHFVYVLKSILFDRGEKADEILQIEIKRVEEMRTMKLDILKSIIDYKLNRGQTVGSDMGPNRNIINKKIQYTILNGEFKLQNFDLMFSRVEVTRASGTHQIYKNRNSKVDIDIDKILIENYADTEAYRTVLCQGAGHSASDPTSPSGDTMIKIRTRDKYVVVKDAPWRVYDQFEVFIFPTSIQFTRNFYRQIKNFFFSEMPNLDLDKSMEEIKKYELLVPKKILNKAKAKYKAKAKDTTDPQEKLVLSVSTENQSAILKKQIGASSDGIFTLQLNAAMHTDDRDNYYTHDQKAEVAHADDNIAKSSQPKTDFPIFFRYTRMNEIMVSITYFHKKNSFFNSKDLKIKLTPFIRHGKFVNFKRLFEKYENHCKKNFIKQIPSLIKQKFLQTRENLKGGVKNIAGVGNGDLEDDDDDDEKMENKKEIKLHNARRILFGEFYET